MVVKKFYWHGGIFFAKGSPGKNFARIAVKPLSKKNVFAFSKNFFFRLANFVPVFACVMFSLSLLDL